MEALEGRLLLATVNWIGGSGDWNTAANWLDATDQTNRVPGASDDAVIDVAGATVSHSSGAHTVQSLTINNAFTQSGGTLVVTGNLFQRNANTFTMTGGILRNATVVGEGGAVLSAANATLDAVTLGGTAGAIALPARLQIGSSTAVTGGLALANGSLVDVSSFLSLNGSQTVDGDGEIRLFFNGSQINTTGQITFGPGLTIHRADSANSAINMVNGSITNLGTIRADSGGTIRVEGSGATTFANGAGGVLAADGGTLNLSTAWSSAGQIVVNNSTINLGGSFTTAGIGAFASRFSTRSARFSSRPRRESNRVSVAARGRGYRPGPQHQHQPDRAVTWLTRRACFTFQGSRSSFRRTSRWGTASAPACARS